MPMPLGRSLTTVSFWLGTVLPVAYLPVIVAGIDSVNRLSIFIALLVVHVLALIVGHEYDGTRSRSRTQ